ncbi:uncharacterized protein N7518_000317 [Penicillium psychrosexuale]|uniref:uncharacterized protein n=1 Tax=Penicillium psychrosexuale TaxID=1002107 RepID=UPI0025457E22|nr:uncharacterized protein N7518_000317 [Penicillium psychrosexuale]KAJ5804014.1 hypothetical protein N7518_000317 [Penicillium psychrosexuale]
MVIPLEGVESAVVELVRLAEEKGGRVMNNIASNLIWIVVVCAAALGGISFVYWFVRRLCDRTWCPGPCSCSFSVSRPEAHGSAPAYG